MAKDSNSLLVNHRRLTTSEDITISGVPIPRSLTLDHDERIVGGVPVEEGEFPFYVYPVGMMLCGATLIHPE
jgi:hypothetical protein